LGAPGRPVGAVCVKLRLPGSRHLVTVMTAKINHLTKLASSFHSVVNATKAKKVEQVQPFSQKRVLLVLRAPARHAEHGRQGLAVLNRFSQ
jgi:hypothetical protein